MENEASDGSAGYTGPRRHCTPQEPVKTESQRGTESERQGAPGRQVASRARVATSNGQGGAAPGHLTYHELTSSFLKHRPAGYC